MILRFGQFWSKYIKNHVRTASTQLNSYPVDGYAEGIRGQMKIMYAPSNFIR